MMNNLRIFKVIEVGTDKQTRILQHALHLFRAVLGQRNAALLFVLFVIVRAEALYDFIDGNIQFRLVVGGSRNDERGERFVDQDRIDRSEENTSELQSLMRLSYAVFCLKKK